MDNKLGLVNIRYVVYDDDGHILSIQNSSDPKYNNLETNFENVEDFLNGTKSFLRHKVEYDFIDKEYKIMDIEKYNETLMRESFLYKLPTNSDTDPEIKLIQNNITRHWNLIINPNLPNELFNKNIKIDPKLQHFSVTKKNDPNVLITILKFNNTLTIPFENNFKFDKDEVSVYTIRKFSSYKHEVVNG